MNDEEAKKRILARRALFVAAALSGGATAGLACDGHPFACLEPAAIDAGGGPKPPPSPCLSTPVLVPDAGATIDSGAAPGDGGSPPPEVVRDAGRPVPMPCLSMPAPKADAGVSGNGTKKPEVEPRVCLYK